MTNEDYHRKTVGEWLSLPFVWNVPVYQRHYAWDPKDNPGPTHLFWETVREQTKARLTGENPPPHYLGAVLVDDKTDHNTPNGITHYDVVDGQQRLTTIQIALLALIRAAKKYGYEPSTKEALKKYVFSDETKNTPRLFPTNFDEEQFKTILFKVYGKLFDRDTRENAKKSKIEVTWEKLEIFCHDLVQENKEYKEEEVIEAIMKALTEGFDLVLIVLRKADDAQKVFESLNNTAKPLTTFDLIRNYVFSLAESQIEATDMFNMRAWQQLETPYWEENADRDNSHIEVYIARMLVAKMKRPLLVSRNEIFKTYKEFSRLGDHSSIYEEVKSLTSYTDIYRYLDNPRNARNPVDPNFNSGIFNYSVWKDRDFYPVIFLIVDATIDAEEKQRMLNLLESYVIRREVCKLTGKAYNQRAADLCIALGNAPSYEKLDKALKGWMVDTAIFPNDEMVIEKAPIAKFDKSPLRTYVLEKIENYLRDPDAEKITTGEYPVGLILPLKWEENLHWKEMILSDKDSSPFLIGHINTILIHTIGNMALMSENNETFRQRENNPFETVKRLLSSSNLISNRSLVNETSWSPEKIELRSQALANLICEIWPYDIEK